MSPIGNLALCFTLLCALPALAEEGPVTAPPGMARFQIGGLDAVSLRDGGWVLSVTSGDLGAGVGAAAVKKLLADAHAPTDEVRLDVDALLVRVPKHVVLLDTGLGPKLPGALPQSLKMAGIAPDTITDILITHVHDDHAGGLLTDGTAADSRLAFPQARIRMSSREWAYLQKTAPAAAKLDAPNIVTFEPGREILPGITPIALYGHTPGHVGYEIVAGGQKIEDIGDLVHSDVVELARPQWTGHIDMDIAEGAAVRTKELARLASTHELVFAPHFPFPGVGWIVPQGDGYAWMPDRQSGH